MEENVPLSTINSIHSCIIFSNIVLSFRLIPNNRTTWCSNRRPATFVLTTPDSPSTVTLQQICFQPILVFIAIYLLRINVEAFKARVCCLLRLNFITLQCNKLQKFDLLRIYCEWKREKNLHCSLMGLKLWVMADILCCVQGCLTSTIVDIPHR